MPIIPLWTQGAVASSSSFSALAHVSTLKQETFSALAQSGSLKTDGFTVLANSGSLLGSSFAVLAQSALLRGSAFDADVEIAANFHEGAFLTMAEAGTIVGREPPPGRGQWPEDQKHRKQLIGNTPDFAPFCENPKG